MLWVLISACEIGPALPSAVDSVEGDSSKVIVDSAQTALADHTDTHVLDTGILVKTGRTTPAELIAFAETLMGVPYVYASSDPAIGFDCSGFISYVFSHFNISVPRSSVDFTGVGKTVALNDAKPGDLILFTGTDPGERAIGHMGIIVSNNAPALQFIHSTSGKAMGVTITSLNDQYCQRFVRVSRIFL